MKRLQKNNGYLLLEIVNHPCYYNGAGEIFLMQAGHKMSKWDNLCPSTKEHIK
jgi:hypothetical protein